jgi:hypothetical protein
VASAACSFTRDDIYILREHTPIGVTGVYRSGAASGAFVNVGVPSLNGIVFDTVGSFDHQLLVTGPANGKTTVVAIDCAGGVHVLTASAPVLEGGLAVAPASFGTFGGDLIAPDELSGVIWAIAPDGPAHQVVSSGLPKGGDIGVESLGFVPPGFAKGGYVYYSDRKTTGSPHPGTDSVLRISSADLLAQGVQEGDLLAATEGGASMIDVRCTSSCQVLPVVGTPTTAHGEGHLAFTLNPPRPSPSPVAIATLRASKGSGSGGVPILAVVAAAVAAALAGAAAALLLTRRRR